MTAPFDQATRPVGKTALRLPAFGLGGGPLGNLYRAITDEAAETLVREAIASGVGYFDTAPFYGLGLSERRLGDALRPHPAGSYVLSSKVGRLLTPNRSPARGELRHGFATDMPFEPVYAYDYDAIMRSYEDSLQRLGLSKIDILYVHDIGRRTHGDDHDTTLRTLLDSGVRALDELRRSGDVQAVGLGVNENEVCVEVLGHADFDLFMLAGRYTLLDQSGHDELLPACLKRGISIVAAGPYNSGLLATGTRTAAVPYYDYGPAPEPILQRVRKLEDLCDQYAVPLAAAALQFPLAHPAVCSVVAGVGTPQRIAQTQALFRTAIPGEFWDAARAAGLIDAGAPTPTGAAAG